MRNLTSAVVILSASFLWSSLGGAQSSLATTTSDTDNSFSAIHVSLLHAADSALDDAYATEATVDFKPEDQKATFVVPQRDGKRGNGRLESLRPIIQPILIKEGVPEELSAVVLVESAGNPQALSTKGARGIWQLMPETARRYGLAVNSRIDERVDVEKSTTGAARYLRDLYVQFGSWPLALAAYNTGEHNLQRAIVRAGSNEFATLSFLKSIPSETRNYVPAVLAAMGASSPPSQPSLETVRQTRFVYASSAQ